MSQTKYHMSKDINRIAIEMVRGHVRRVKIYHDMRYAILNESPCSSEDSVTGGDEKLEVLETLPETMRMKAVDNAKMHIGLDIANEPERIKLVNAIWDSCLEGRNFTVSYHNLCVGKDNFYERRRKFLYEIAQHTGFI